MIRIYADSTNDLGRGLIEKYDIRIVPLYVRMGDKVVQDGYDLDTEELYRWAEAHKETPATAAFSPGDAEDALREAVEAGDDVLFFGISSEISASCNAFRIAAAGLDYSDHVFVVDSRSLGNGIGLLILKAAALIARGGRTAAEIWLEIQKLIPAVRVSFVVDTLTYLYRGGRCSAVSALTASALGIKPKIVMNNGKMTVSTKYRGKPEVVARKYIGDMKHDLLKADPEAIFVYNSGVPDSVLEVMKREVEDLKHFENIYYTKAGGIISSHCGPGTISIMYMDKV